MRRQHHELAALQAIRREAEGLVEKLVSFLDILEPDPDLEPLLGAPEQSLHHLPRDQTYWANGADDGREDDEADDPRGEYDRSDFEPDTDADLELNGDIRGGSLIGC